jgi:putative oxidoreductase
MDRHRVNLVRPRAPRPVASARAGRSLAPVWAVVDRHAALAARMSLALVFVWFGLLKVLGDSPVTRLVTATVPFGNPHVVVGVLGGVEVALGAWLALGRAPRLLALCLVGHLTGTFLTFLMAPSMTMRHDNPLLLTADGEFVVKNVVLISTTLLIVSVAAGPRRPVPVTTEYARVGIGREASTSRRRAGRRPDRDDAARLERRGGSG